MKALKLLACETAAYINRNKLKSAAVILAMVLAYGFYVTSYTLNVDDAFTSFWNGGRLIAAGRFSGYLVQLLTGIMTYSPFFTMFLALCIYYFAGIVTAVVLNRYAEGKLSDQAVFVFWMIYVTYPLISEQMVYPIIVLLALGFLMTAVALWLTDRFYEEKSISSLVVAIGLMVLAIDFYEAFAAVYLTLMMASVLIRFFYSEDPSAKKLPAVFFRMLKLTAVLLAAIVIRFALSKLALFLYYGTTHAGYSGNNQIYWLQIGLLDCAIWLIRTVFFYYFWAGIDYFPIFLFALCAIVGLICSVVLSVRKKSAIPALGFLFMIAGALSLNVVLGIATNYTMAQPLTLFAAASVMGFYIIAEKKKTWRYILGVLIVLLVLNQAKCLNNWSVANYERYEYEMAVVDDIGQDLEENYDVETKPVIFIGKNDAPLLPDALLKKHETQHPLVVALQKAAIRLSDAVLPKRFFSSIGGFYGHEVKNASDLFSFVQRIRNRTSISSSYLSWATNDTVSWFSSYEDCTLSEETYALFEQRGYELLRCSNEAYETYASAGDALPVYPKKGSIAEIGDYIYVNFGA